MKLADLRNQQAMGRRVLTEVSHYKPAYRVLQLQHQDSAYNLDAPDLIPTGQTIVRSLTRDNWPVDYGHGVACQSYTLRGLPPGPARNLSERWGAPVAGAEPAFSKAY